MGVPSASVRLANCGRVCSKSSPALFSIKWDIERDSMFYRDCNRIYTSSQHRGGTVHTRVNLPTASVIGTVGLSLHA